MNPRIKLTRHSPGHELGGLNQGEEPLTKRRWSFGGHLAFHNLKVKELKVS